MRKIILLPILFILVQCVDNGSDILISDKQSAGKGYITLPSITFSVPLIDKQLISKIENHFSQSIRQSQKANARETEVDFNFSEGTQYRYEGGDDTAVTFPSPKTTSEVSYDFIVYLDENNNPYDAGLIRKVSLINDQPYKLEFYDENFSYIDGVEWQSGSLVRLYGDGSDNRAWSICVKAKFEDMANGTIAGSTAGLICMALGVECAAGIALGCAVSWMLNW